MNMGTLNHSDVVPFSHADRFGNSVESTFPTWLEKLYQSIDHLFPAAPGFTVLSPDTLPPPRIRLTPSNSIASGSKDPPALYPWTEDGGWATVKRLERFTGEDWFQDVRNLQLEIEGGTSSVNRCARKRPILMRGM